MRISSKDNQGPRFPDILREVNEIMERLPNSSNAADQDAMHALSEGFADALLRIDSRDTKTMGELELINQFDRMLQRPPLVDHPDCQRLVRLIQMAKQVDDISPRYITTKKMRFYPISEDGIPRTIVPDYVNPEPLIEKHSEIKSTHRHRIFEKGAAVVTLASLLGGAGALALPMFSKDAQTQRANWKELSKGSQIRRMQYTEPGMSMDELAGELMYLMNAKDYRGTPVFTPEEREKAQDYLKKYKDYNALERKIEGDSQDYQQAAFVAFLISFVSLVSAVGSVAVRYEQDQINDRIRREARGVIGQAMAKAINKYDERHGPSQDGESLFR